MRKDKKISACPICDSSQLKHFFSLEAVPVHIGVLWPDKDTALTAPRGAIKLAFCRECGHIFNASYDDCLMTYELPYDNSLFFSSTFRQFASDLCNNLIKKYSLRHKKILEIGSGKGDFLKLLCELGENKGWGFDPSYQPDFQPHPISNNLTFVQGYYNKNLLNDKVDLVYARHTLEHLTNPKKLIQQLKKDFNGNPDIIFYFEVPNADFMIRETNLWDLIYEHCQYFTSSSLRILFEKNGFKVLDLYEAFDDQYLCIECKILDEDKENLNKLDIDKNLVSQFANKSYQIISLWEKKLKEMAIKNSKCVVWGAGAKGVSFLNILQNEEVLIGVVDINPRKQGKYIPLTGQRIFLPGELKAIQPEKVIVMNPIYVDEIKSILQENGLQSDLCLTV